MKIEGKVEMVGTQFNGSLKVNGKFYNFPKNYKGSKDFKVGDEVVINLKKWEFGGKTGWNIGSVEAATKESLTAQVAVIQNAKGIAPAEFLFKKAEELAEKDLSGATSGNTKGRDYEKEARGKTRCQMFSAALQSPGLTQFATGDIDDFLQLVEGVANAGVRYTFND